MSLHAITDTTGTADLAELRRSARAGDASAARKTAEQFEALFVQMMVKQMREAMPTDSGLFGGGESQKLYEEMHDQQLSLAMARRGGLGIADAIERQLLPQGMDPAKMAQPLHFPTERLPARPANIQGAAPSGAPAERGDPAAFVQRLLPHAQRAAARLGIAPEVLIAQSALETGWGRHEMRDAHGQPSNNLFGIKATGGWDGARVKVSTLEYRDGVARREMAAFRGYADEASSFADYARLIGDHPRYRKALDAPTPEAYLRELQAAGYATDPAYADKILGILERGLPGLSAPATPAPFSFGAKPPITPETGDPGIARVRPHPAGEETT
ncbi:flagellar assembly peptidoglycan hydrolase FlgJ [Wenzhouxiangella sp. XN24]|uniref:flagellar assembly peptidoglycan hydrolase FlgJ n=1 Tax=Wenzhouxiangella sp. XN24 TaxID=2713569 RepID=UPI0013ECA0D1|nr:flagellar assembly peptidoglycan hydrolase FlgJ [Wenzhouxiangella sp. XN24]NGX16218.1 flagellar assembly peptidoglycan hydrolase FlgJ [Wenzhouxiangella sp. XN24]